MTPSMNEFICFAAIVAMKLRDDYNVSVDVLPQPWFASKIMTAVHTGDDTSSVAFKIANEYQAGQRWNKAEGA